MDTLLLLMTILAIGLGVLLKWTLVIVSEREAVIKERLGRPAPPLKPGPHIVIPVLERVAYRHEMREQVIDIPPQNCITKDNIQVTVDGVVYLKVVNPYAASYGIESYARATVNLAQTTMRAEIGKLSLDDTFSERESINESIVREIDKASDPWGIKMIRYEIRNISPSAHIIDTMEKQMEAERKKRATITISDGERQARIMIAEGQRQAAINASEGERQKRVNEAEGAAASLRIKAEAKAEAVRRIAEAIQAPGGRLAMRNELVETYLTSFHRVLARSKVTVLPAEIAEIRGLIEGATGALKNIPVNTKGGE